MVNGPWSSSSGVTTSGLSERNVPSVASMSPCPACSVCPETTDRSDPVSVASLMAKEVAMLGGDVSDVQCHAASVRPVPIRVR